MGPFERMRDRLAAGDTGFRKIDAVQLVKHAFGLRTEGQRRGKLAMLLYLYAEPDAWGNGTPVNRNHKKTHAQEAERFASEVAGAEVTFSICVYRKLLEALRENSHTDLCRHADMIEARFRP